MNEEMGCIHMTKVTINNLKPGMFTAAPVYSATGQLILPEHSILTIQQISRLEFYGIEWVAIIPEEELRDSAMEKLSENEHEEIISYSQKIRRSKSFHLFRIDYGKKLSILRQSMNDLLKKNVPVDTASLLDQISSLYQNNMTTLSIFDMLHNMRQIDDSTYAHSLNVALIARMIGEWLGLSEETLDSLTLAGLLHDIGKCMISPEIIGKPALLTTAEYDEVKKHARYGAEILEKQPLDKRVIRAALMHHERCDGTGYPMGLKDKEIDDFAKIIAIADVYDAMTSNRCYRKGLCPFEVIATFEREGLEKYDSRYILTFLNRIVDTYICNSVLLNDGTCGKIVLMNQHSLSRPVIHTMTNNYIDLTKHPELHIQAII